MKGEIFLFLHPSPFTLHPFLTMLYFEDCFGLIRNLTAARFRLQCRPIERIVLPEYKGSTFRGVLGWRLRKVICVDREATDCTGCLLGQKCLYKYLFSPPLPENTQFMRNISQIPSPIIIEPPLTPKKIFEPTDTFELGLVLTGKGLEYLPYLIYVFKEIGKSGIGASIHAKKGKNFGGRFELVEVYDDIGEKLVYSQADGTMHSCYKIISWNDIMAESAVLGDNLTIDFLTPVRVKEMQGNDIKLTKLKSFPQLIAHLYWRLLNLAYFHCNPNKLDDEQYNNLTYKAGQERKKLSQIEDVYLAENHTYWQEYDRWSNRQQTKMTLGGFMGRATFSGNLTPYLPLLRLGEYAHLGKQTMFGLGKYKINKPVEIT